MLYGINGRSDIAEGMSRELKGIAIKITWKRNIKRKKGKEHQLDKLNWTNKHIVGILNEGEGRKKLKKNNDKTVFCFFEQQNKLSNIGL